MSDLFRMTLAEASAAVHAGDVSPVELTASALERAEVLNPLLNAYITVLADSALASARAAEAELRAGQDRGPLHGIPLSLKDLIDVAGVRTTAGATVPRDEVATHDATVTAKLAAAGAVIVAKANMLEFAYGEVHPAFGPACNPWNLDWGTSGSSSGSGASVAAGLDFGSVGSDTGGSIRFPSAYCGLVGLKPTYGLVSRVGVVPLAWSLDHLGPMTRTARDNALMLQAMAGFDPRDPASENRPVPDFTALLGNAPDGLTIGVVASDPGEPLDSDVERVTGQAIAAMRDAGFRVVPVTLPEPVQAARALLAIMYAEATAFHWPWLRDYREFYSQNTLDRLELGTLLPATVEMQARRARAIIVEQYRQLFGAIDLLLTPVGHSAGYRLIDAPADPVVESGDRMKSLIKFSGPFNLTGYPALTLPSGFSDAGLPIAVQLVARPFAEPVLYQAADLLERQVGQFGRVVDPVSRTVSA